ncbi:MAG TPA: hypothetical protein PLS84_07665 [Salinivirgaceae bacterium]|jgi:hypothetical protein|nr:hypothetical protein [Bacteroidales bacterium]HPW66948.1 hypothetical protein [Salinivirgaceae bacterium]
METIFDHNPTEIEMQRFKGFQDKEFRELYLKHPNINDYNYHLYLLFRMRGDNKRADEIYPKLSSGHKGLLMRDF